jgi:hypothetical protein
MRIKTFKQFVNENESAPVKEIKGYVEDLRKILTDKGFTARNNDPDKYVTPANSPTKFEVWLNQENWPIVFNQNGNATPMGFPSDPAKHQDYYNYIVIKKLNDLLKSDLR